MKRLQGSILLAMMLCTVPLGASEGRIPIFEPLELLAASGDPIGGRYVLTRDVIAVTGRAIHIVGNGFGHVDIDLNGFTLGVGAAGSEVVDIRGLKTLTIRNGVIRNATTTGNNVVVKDIDQLILEDLKISNGKYGIFLNTGVKSFAIRHNTIESTGDSGILVNYTNDSGAAEVAEGSIIDNSIREPGIAATLPNGGRGIEVRFGVSSVVVQDNRIERALSYGITTNSNGAVVLSGNRVNEPGYRGIIASRTSACRISENVVRGAGVLQDGHPDRGGDGLFINDTASDCLVIDNVSSGNWMSGLRVEGDRNHVERNVLNNNTQAGLHFEGTGDGNTYGRNTARDNASTHANPIGSCAVNGCSTATSRNVCDEGAGNTSFGDNLAPGPPPC